MLLPHGTYIELRLMRRSMGSRKCMVAQMGTKVRNSFLEGANSINSGTLELLDDPEIEAIYNPVRLAILKYNDVLLNDWASFQTDYIMNGP